MTDEQLEKGAKIRDNIKKYKIQLENLSYCDKVQLLGKVTSGNRQGQSVDYGITKDHPMYSEVLAFIEKLKTHLEAKIKELETEFSKL